MNNWLSPIIAIGKLIGLGIIVLAVIISMGLTTRLFKNHNLYQLR